MFYFRLLFRDFSQSFDSGKRTSREKTLANRDNGEKGRNSSGKFTAEMQKAWNRKATKKKKKKKQQQQKSIERQWRSCARGDKGMERRRKPWQWCKNGENRLVRFLSRGLTFVLSQKPCHELINPRVETAGR